MGRVTPSSAVVRRFLRLLDQVEPRPGRGCRVIPQLKLSRESVRKVCQLTGEWDRQRKTFAHNRTETRVGLVGTDLGASFEHDGRLWFLFGDTWPDAELGDSVAWTTDRTPEPGIRLLAEELSEIFGRPVDLVSRVGLHPMLAASVLDEARPLYAA